jgi:NitT/TauT family transport system substrate-binding protein
MVGVYYAVQQGWFAQAGLDVTLQQAPSGAAATTAVVGGAAQIGYSNTLALSTAHAKGVPIVLLSPGAQYRTNIPHAVLVVASDATFKTAKDLVGKTVAVAGLHDLLGISTVAWLTKNGVDPASVHFIEIPPATMQAALQAHRVDGAAMYEPFLSAATQSGNAKVFAKPYDAIGLTFLTGAWFAMDSWASTHHEAAVKFAQILDRASTYVNGHYDDLIPLITQVTKLPPETLQHMVKMYTPPKLQAGSIQPVIDTAVAAHEIPSTFHASDFILSGVPQ